MRDGFLDDELREVRLLWLAMLFRHSGGPKRQAHFVHATADAGHHRRTEGDVGSMSDIEDDTQPRLDSCHVVGGKLTNLIACRTLVHVHLTDYMCQFTGVNLHRTGR